MRRYGGESSSRPLDGNRVPTPTHVKDLWQTRFRSWLTCHETLALGTQNGAKPTGHDLAGLADDSVHELLNGWDVTD